ncbi:MAG: Gx transporter family protein [Clostridiales Family XIII bacterium]|nr:Gx transporter family protein [Clostridiales Family XIII bacterium]
MERKPAAPKGGAAKWGDVAMAGLFLAFILVTGLMERALPLDMIVPGARLGLSNVAILAAVYLFRFRTALALTLMKCLLLSMLAGGPSYLLYSLGGSLPAVAAMWALARALGDRVSPVGVSVAGAACHSVGQTLTACAALENMWMLAYLPPLLLVSAASGAVVGLIAKQALPRLRAAGWAGRRR